MTLSHRWGRADCLKLTTDNHAQLLDGVSLSTLPQLYQDAIYVTRCLGIRYLWIDSLCIIQQGDDSADCQHEIMLMDKVYAYSFCNISAADAFNELHSMFCTRDPKTLYPQTVRLAADGHVGPYLLCDSTVWKIEVSDALLNKRAWVLQERLLAPRVLHFGRSQLVWECRDRDASEIYPDGLPIALLGSTHSRFKDLNPCLHSPANNNSDSMIAVYQIWTRIVRAYTACDLTFPGDKLVALSAVAKVIADRLQDEYVAGMWRRFLERELLWSMSGNSTGCSSPSRPKIYCVPSWSWAAVDGPVNPGLPDVEASDLLIKVEDLHLDHPTDHQFGSIQGGWLRLRGVLKQLALLPHVSATAIHHGDWDMIINGLHVSIPTESMMREPQPHVMLDQPHDNFTEQNADGTLFCMPARVRKGKDGSIYILILELHDRERGVFRRIGIARGWGEVVKQRVLAYSTEQGRFPCEEYRCGEHSILIV